MDTADTTAGERFGRFGLEAPRLVAALALVLLVLGATMGTAGAETNTPKQTFIKNCTASGGSVQEYTGEIEGVVQCTYVKGGTITTVGCEFTGPILWVCGASQQPDSHGTPIRRPAGLRTQTVRPGTVLVFVDEDR